MGQVESREIGARSARSEGSQLTDDEPIDYKNSTNETKAKRELYALFLEDKLVLTESLHKSAEKIESLEAEIQNLKEKITTYESAPSIGISPVWTSDQARSPKEPERASEKEEKRELKGSEDPDRKDNKEEEKEEKKEDSFAPSSSGKISRIAEKIRAAQKNIRRSKSRP